MHRPGIEPGPPAWQASILPLKVLFSVENFSFCVFFIFLEIKKLLIVKNLKAINTQGIVGSVVECSPATRAARVRFPDDASFYFA